MTSLHEHHPSITAPHGVSYTLMLRVRARRFAQRAARQLGLPVDSAGLERAVVGKYRATGNPHDGVRAMRAYADAIEAAIGGGGAA